MLFLRGWWWLDICVCYGRVAYAASDAGVACVMCAWGAGPGDGWRNHYILPNHLPNNNNNHHHQRALQDVTADNRRFTERRKKTVRFDHGDGGGIGGGSAPAAWDEERQGSQDSQTKDSGIDTSSTFTSSEDSNRGDVPKVGHTLCRQTYLESQYLHVGSDYHSGRIAFHHLQSTATNLFLTTIAKSTQSAYKSIKYHFQFIYTDLYHELNTY